MLRSLVGSEMCIRDRSTGKTTQQPMEALLRGFADGTVEVSVHGDELEMGGQRYDKALPVSIEEKTFELAQLWCFLSHGQHKPGAEKKEYRRACRTGKIQPVKILDVQTVADYFSAEEPAERPSKLAREEVVASIPEEGKPGMQTEKLIRTYGSVLLGPCEYKQRVFGLLDELFHRAAKGREPTHVDYQRDKAWESRPSDPGATALGIDMTGSNMLGNATTLKPLKPLPSPKQKQVVPILVVPLGRSAMVNMFNVRAFLEQGKYETVTQSMKRNPKKESKLFLRPKDFVNDPRLQVVEVIDSVKNLKEKDWPRVVGVLVQGPTWQFKDWKWKDIPEIFNRVTAFHVCWDDEDKNENILKWSFKILQLNKEYRGKDLTVAKLFWTHLEETTRKKQRGTPKRKRDGH
eukprot:TRINITY_DN30584_c0_g1_i1.p1 TRINITY_DN30584_c0_g1~~TRINITY_DN30584_c0_g1_i1.p1  ORF type:complete len:405 (-),score=111.35 TRINITY_DN30584_c0_g1_i1:201-1415(-)